MSESVGHVIREIYCEVIFELAEEAGHLEDVMEDLSAVSKIMQDDHEFAALLYSPTVKPNEKSDVIHRVFQGKLHDLTLDFLCVLAKRNRMNSLFGIHGKYETMYDIHHNRRLVEVTLAEEPDQDEIERIKADLTKAIKSEVKLTIDIDPSIIGGIIIKKDGKVVDNSLKTALSRAVMSVMNQSRDQAKK
jgi:F-type H+-transporting ATPase subunit delta